ncbi:MAG TPA: hypothetical protein VFC76_04925 [Oscillospiraceae bacterium]|nr:hypothetical protein [Oscillospiraceae bacterium]
MAETKMIPIGQDFDLNEMVRSLIQIYQAKGFEVTAMQMGNGVSISFSKDDGGIKKIAGLALGVTANITINNNALMVNFTDAEWTGKIIAAIIGVFLGWILLLIPFFTAGYGAVKQMDLPKTIGKDIQMFAGGGAPMGVQQWQ